MQFVMRRSDHRWVRASGAFKDLGYFRNRCGNQQADRGADRDSCRIEDIKRFGVNAGVWRAKALIAGCVSPSGDRDGVAEQLAYYEALGDWKTSEDYITAIQSVSAPNVVNAAKKYLTFQNLSAYEYCRNPSLVRSPSRIFNGPFCRTFLERSKNVR
jgi:hypothetical protein